MLFIMQNLNVQPSRRPYKRWSEKNCSWTIIMLKMSESLVSQRFSFLSFFSSFFPPLFRVLYLLLFILHLLTKYTVRRGKPLSAVLFYEVISLLHTNTWSTVCSERTVPRVTGVLRGEVRDAQVLVLWWVSTWRPTGSFPSPLVCGAYIPLLQFTVFLRSSVKKCI